MEIVVDIGLLLQIFGVFIVLLGQVQFVCRAWRKYRSLKRAFFEMLNVVRVRQDDTTTLSEETIEEIFPEWWTLASYLSDDIWITFAGLVVTLIGLFFELSKLRLVV